MWVYVVLVRAGADERVFCALEIGRIDEEMDVVAVDDFGAEVSADFFLIACEIDFFEDCGGISGIDV